MQKLGNVGLAANEAPTQQEAVLYALQRLENLIYDMTNSMFGPQNISVPPEGKLEIIGIRDAMFLFMSRLEAGLDAAHNNLDAIQSALSSLPNKGVAK